MFKRLISLCLCLLLMVGVLVACNNNKTPEGKTSETTTSGGSINGVYNKPEDVARDFINAVIGGEYDTAITMLDIDNTKSFITGEDMSFFLPRSKFTALLGDSVKGADLKLTPQGNSGSTSQLVSAVFSKDGTDTVNMEIPVVQGDNGWRIDAPEFYYSNFRFLAPSGDVTVTANGKPVDKSYITDDAAGGTKKAVIYTLPYVGKKEVKVKVSCDNFENEVTMPATSENTEFDDYNTLYYLKAEEREEVNKSIKDAWNGMYKDWLSGKNATDLLKYLSDDADPDITNRVVSGFKSMSDTGSSGNDNFNLVEVNQGSDNNYVFYVSDDMVYVNFNYKLTWNYKLMDWSQETKRKSSIILKKVNGEYKIYQLVDEKLFTECNNFTSEW